MFVIELRDKIKDLEQKEGKLKIAQLENYSIKDFEKLIKEKIKDNYIYEMSELKEFNVIKFNVINYIF